MLAIIELDYTRHARLKELTPEQRQQLRDEVPQMKLTAEDSSYMHSESEFMCDLATDGQLLLSLGLQFSVKRFKSCYRVSDNDPWQKRDPAQAVVHNIQVAIPNILLWEIDEVRVLDDSCTDTVQSYLDDGWRILAICPPPAQRRPDYIMGRQRPKGGR